MEKTWNARLYVSEVYLNKIVTLKNDEDIFWEARERVEAKVLKLEQWPLYPSTARLIAIGSIRVVTSCHLLFVIA